VPVDETCEHVLVPARDQRQQLLVVMNRASIVLQWRTPMSQVFGLNAETGGRL
jgi:hypothetical protein